MPIRLKDRLLVVTFATVGFRGMLLSITTALDVTGSRPEPLRSM